MTKSDKKLLAFIESQIIKANSPEIKGGTGQTTVQVETLVRVLEAISKETVDDAPGLAFEVLKIMKYYEIKKVLLPLDFAHTNQFVVLEG